MQNGEPAAPRRSVTREAYRIAPVAHREHFDHAFVYANKPPCRLLRRGPVIIRGFCAPSLSSQLDAIRADAPFR